MARVTRDDARTAATIARRVVYGHCWLITRRTAVVIAIYLVYHVCNVGESSQTPCDVASIHMTTPKVRRDG